ncbi:protein rolling stone-like [Lineus longissimus]|uniref:protein rolling stone-like n=1 Tax=Lineus longissimus TaxID=88925 RepID=UPI002B4EBA7B
MRNSILHEGVPSLHSNDILNLDNFGHGPEKIESIVMTNKLCCPGNKCSLSQFGFDHPRPMVFVTPQWHFHPWFYITYRAFAAIYWLVILICSGAIDYNGWYTKPEYAVRWFVFLTSWNQTLMTVTAILLAVFTIHYYYDESLMRKDAVVLPKMPIRFRIIWLFYSLYSPIACLITSGYWLLQYEGGTPHFIDLNLHGINTVYVIVDVILSHIPFRIQHIFYPMMYSGVYFIFNAIYAIAGGKSPTGLPYIYKVLDWRYPRKTSLIAILAILVATPVATLFLWGLSIGRDKLNGLLYEKDSEEEENDVPVCAYEMIDN